MRLEKGLGRAFRTRVHEQLETERWKRKGLSPTNWFLLFLILGSLVLYTAETEREFQASEFRGLTEANVLILIVFCAEFVARLWAAGADERFKGWAGRGAYIRAHPALFMADFLAFAPELLLLSLGLTPPGALRSLRVIRLFKMARYFPTFKLVVDALRSCVQELLVALSLSVVLWYLAAVLLYLAEGDVQPDGFGSITRSMWWSVVTLTTVGYGDIYPVTAIGKVAAGIVAVIGLGTVALPSGIIAGAFMEKFRTRRQP